MASDISKAHPPGEKHHESERTIRDRSDALVVPARTGYTIIMIPCTIFFCLLQVSFAVDRPGISESLHTWFLISALLALILPWALAYRQDYPEAVFGIALISTLLCPYEPLFLLIALSSLVARRMSSRWLTACIIFALAVCCWSQVRDALQPYGASVWHSVFSPDTHGDIPIYSDRARTVIIALSASAGLAVFVVSMLIGLHLRSKAQVQLSDAKARAAAQRSQILQNDLDGQRLADAIAAEAHDTLAHTLSLIALHAGTQQIETLRLRRLMLQNDHSTKDGDDNPDAQSANNLIEGIETRNQDIRQQADKAMREAHAIIDMLKHPGKAVFRLSDTGDNSLTRDSIDQLLADARNAGSSLNTWIDVRSLDQISPAAGALAYRVIREGLTNARRHANEHACSLDLKANPQDGIHIHITNPTTVGHAHENGIEEMATDPHARTSAGGNGLASMRERVESFGGSCEYGTDEQRLFHLVVDIPVR